MVERGRAATHDGDAVKRAASDDARANRLTDAKSTLEFIHAIVGGVADVAVSHARARRGVSGEFEEDAHGGIDATNDRVFVDGAGRDRRGGVLLRVAETETQKSRSKGESDAFGRGVDVQHARAASLARLVRVVRIRGGGVRDRAGTLRVPDVERVRGGDEIRHEVHGHAVREDGPNARVDQHAGEERGHDRPVGLVRDDRRDAFGIGGGVKHARFPDGSGILLLAGEHDVEHGPANERAFPRGFTREESARTVRAAAKTQHEPVVLHGLHRRGNVDPLAKRVRRATGAHRVQSSREIDAFPPRFTLIEATHHTTNNLANLERLRQRERVRVVVRVRVRVGGGGVGGGDFVVVAVAASAVRAFAGEGFGRLGAGDGTL